MNLLRRVNHPRPHQFPVTRTSPTPPTRHATSATTAAIFSSATQPHKLRPTPSSPRAYIRYLSTRAPLPPPPPSRRSISASPLPSTRTTTSRMSSNVSTPASTQPAAASTPPRAPLPGSNHNAAADASHPHPCQARSDNDDDPSNDTLLKNRNSNSQASSAAAAGGDDGAGTSGGDGGALPALPAPESDGPTTTLEVDGKAVVLDHLGPMVVGRDGTVSRIANWHELSEIERRNTLRVLGKRNQVRLAALRGEDGKAA